jgi:hypothetical protein
VFWDLRGSLWIVTSRSLGRFDPETGGFRHFRFNDQPLHAFEEPLFPSVHVDPGGDFWIGTSQGLLQFDPDRGVFTRYRHDPSDPQTLSMDNILSLQPDPIEPERFLWVGTNGGGLDLFDRQTGRVAHHTEEDGLPNDCIYGILSDQSGRLWLSTNQGLGVFNTRTSAVLNFDMQDGLQSDEFNAGAYYKSRRGELFFGGLRGYNAFFPQLIPDNLYRPPVVINSFLINNRPIDPRTPDSPLRRAIARSSEVELSHTDRVVTFGFAALSFSNPAHNKFAYRLAGFDPDWMYIGTHRSVTFTNLDPGEYVLWVKAANDDGVWNEKGTSLRIRVRPPPWRTWWAYSLMALVAIGLLYGLRRYEISRLGLKHRLSLLHEEIRLASQIQLELMPKQPPVVAGYDIAGKSVPTQLVGGDYFDFIPIGSDRLAICLGDVSGKGLPSALLMANLQAIIRSQSHPGTSCLECVQRSNHMLVNNTEVGKFATLLYGILEGVTGRFMFCNAGHNPAFFFPVAAEPRRLETGGLIIGFASNVKYEQETIQMIPGDFLVIYSDGITEAMNAAEEEFGEARLLDLLQSCRDMSSQEIVDRIMKAAAAHTGKRPQTDDMTVVVVRRVEAGLEVPDFGGL